MPVTPDITILGTIVIDIFVPSVKKFPEKGEAIEVKEFPIFTGGCGSNTSIILSRLGIQVNLIGAIGNDLFGKFILDYLNQNKVNTSLVKISESESTSTSILFINQKNERSYFHSTGANKEILIGERELFSIINSKIFHIGGVNLLPSIDGKPMAELLKKVKSRNVVCSIDLAWDVKNRWMKNLKFSLPFIDILMGNEDEIKALISEKSISNSIKKLHEFGIKIVVVKRGSKGCIVSKNYYLEEIPAFKVRSKDSTGAGDAFAGGFLFGILQGKSLYESAQIGNYFGALVTTDYGSTSALKEFQKFNINKIIS